MHNSLLYFVFNAVCHFISRLRGFFTCKSTTKSCLKQPLSRLPQAPNDCERSASNVGCCACA